MTPTAGYVAPARYVLRILHRQEPGPLPVTVCGLPMAADDLWQDVERQDGDNVCAGCLEPGTAPPSDGEPLFDMPGITP
jgi:hypothetical protein